MWAWDYELRTLGSWPGERYTGHNVPVEVVTKADHDVALRRAKAEVLEVAAKKLCMYCNDPGNWAPMSNSGYHQCNTPGPNMVRCHATKIHALIREADARAAQIENEAIK